MSTTLPPGIYVPIPTFFRNEPSSDQPVDVDAIARHVKYLCSAGVHGIVCMGSTGEAVHLTEDERKLVIRTVKQTINDLATKTKIIAGCSHESVQGTLNLIKQATESGAEYAMVLPPSYFLAWTPNRSDVISSFYTTVADKSPIPIIIYNFPGVTQQMDTTQETIVKLAQHPNIAGIKCTDGNVGKATYVCEHTDPKQFTLMSGSADSFLPFLTVGAQGCVPGFGNIAPRTIVELFNLFISNSNEKLNEIKQIQGKIAGPDHAFFRWNGIAGLKSAMESVLGYGGRPRAPLLPITKEQQEIIVAALQPALEIERELESKSSNK